MDTQRCQTNGRITLTKGMLTKGVLTKGVLTKGVLTKGRGALQAPSPLTRVKGRGALQSHPHPYVA